MAHQVDDLPAHALVVMKQTVDMMSAICPTISREEMCRTFVYHYFQAKESSNALPKS